MMIGSVLLVGSMTNLAQSVSDATMAGAATLNPVRSSNKKGPVDLSQVGSHVIDVSSFKFVIMMDLGGTLPIHQRKGSPIVIN